MKKNGFTLVELLATIIILGVLMLVVTLSVNEVINNSESKLSTIQIENIKDAAKVYYLNEGMRDEGDNTGFSHCVNVSYLIENDYIDDSEMEEENISGSVKITYNSKKYKYIYEEDSCGICSLKSGHPNAIGSKYQCKVKDNMEEGFEDGYYFYVLSTNEDGTTNLIMDRNIYHDSNNDVGLVATESNTGIVVWDSSGQNTSGPVTAMNHLYNATKDWNNVPNIIIDYEDEGNSGSDGGYGKVTTTNNMTKITKKDGSRVTVLTAQEGYTNLKARMPYYSEVIEVGCKANLSSELSCPVWMVDYLNDAGIYYETTYQKNPIDKIYGYWTFSSDDSSEGAWIVFDSGYVEYDGVDIDSYGIRPVITLEI